MSADVKSGQCWRARRGGLLVAVVRVEGRVVVVVAKDGRGRVAQERIELGRFVQLFRRSDVAPPAKAAAP